MRVVMPRGACGNGCLVLILWSRWRCRSVLTRAVAITPRAWWWAAIRAGSGSEAVAVPARTVPIRVRRAVVPIGGGPRRAVRCGGPSGTAPRRRRRSGGGADQLGGDDPGGVLLADQLRGGRAQACPGGRASVVDGRLGLPQRGLRAVPAPLVGLGQLVGGVRGVVEQVGDQAEQLGRGLSVQADVVLDDPHGQGSAAAGQAGQVGPVDGERADTGQPDVRLDADQTWLPVASMALTAPPRGSSDP